MFLLLWIYLAGITVTVQFGWTEQIEKRGLELALLVCQYKTSVVTALTVVHGVGNHCHKPFGEIRQPHVGVAHDDATCQFGNGFQ